MGRRRAGVLLPLEAGILASLPAEQAAEGIHGFALANELSERSGDALTAHGTLYKALSRLADAGLVAANWEDPDIAAEQGRPRRRYYRITAHGAAVLAAQPEPAAKLPRLRAATS